MTSGKHTALPWTQGGIKEAFYDANCTWLGITAIDHGNGGPCREEAEANCALIVAAVNSYPARAKLLAAAKAAELTYRALERNGAVLLSALQASGLPSSWLSQEIDKAQQLREAIRESEGKP